MGFSLAAAKTPVPMITTRSVLSACQIVGQIFCNRPRKASKGRVIVNVHYLDSASGASPRSEFKTNFGLTKLLRLPH